MFFEEIGLHFRQFCLQSIRAAITVIHKWIIRLKSSKNLCVQYLVCVCDLRFSSEWWSVALRGDDLQTGTPDCLCGRRWRRFRSRQPPVSCNHRKSAFLWWWEQHVIKNQSDRFTVASFHSSWVLSSAGCPVEGDVQKCMNPYKVFQGCMRQLTVNRQPVDLIKVQQRLMGNYTDLQIDMCAIIDRSDLNASFGWSNLSTGVCRE